MVRGITVLVLLAAVSASASGAKLAEVRTVDEQRWTVKPLVVGGGGWVTGMVVHPATPGLIYARTDVGGAYRWDEEAEAWRPITDWIPAGKQGLYGIDSVAVDPTDDDVVYLAMGRANPYGGIYRSADRGKTWRKLGFPHGDSIDGNAHQHYHVRTMGERLEVDPSDGQKLLYGCFRSPGGLWKSDDGGESWRRAEIEGVPQQEQLVTLVFYDRLVEGRAYAQVQDRGPFYTVDGGESWAPLPDGDGNHCPARSVRRMDQAADGSVYFTNTLPAEAAGNMVWKIADLRAYDVSPSREELETGPKVWTHGKGMQGLAVDPRDPRHVIVQGGISSSAPGEPVPMYETFDEGGSWQKMSVRIGDYYPWKGREGVLKSTVTDLVWDPHRPTRAYHMDGAGVARIDVSVSPVRADEMSRGIEETVIFDICSVPFEGEERVFSGLADFAGFHHDRGLDRPPSRTLYDLWSGRQSVHAIAYCRSRPTVMYMTGRGNYTQGKDRDRPSGYYAMWRSNDAGRTWLRLPSRPGQSPPSPFPVAGDESEFDVNPLELAVSSRDPENVVVVGQNPMASLDGGATWEPCEGLSDIALGHNWVWTRTLAADPVEGGVFYAYHANDDPKRGEVFRSEDGGLSWRIVNSELPWGRLYIDAVCLQPAPHRAGDLWLNLQDGGLWHSIDGGRSWDAVGGFSDADGGSARVMDLGVPPMGNPYGAAVFVLGRYEGEDGLWVSVDEGATWRNVAPPDKVFANGKVLEASNLSFGRVYLGTTGSGMRYLEAPGAPGDR